jgi:hypothetical protein
LDNAELILSLVRMAERFASVAVGAMCIYLGYRLFISLPELPTGDGSLSLPGKTGLTLWRVGPGVFFSLFGAAIVVASLRSPLTYERSDQPTSHTVKVSAAAMASAPAMTSESRRDAVETSIGDLNAVPRLLDVKVSDAERGDVRRAIDEAKIALLHGAWAAEWGDWEAFRRWTVTRGDPPPLAKEAVRIFEKAKP